MQMNGLSYSPSNESSFQPFVVSSSMPIHEPSYFPSVQSSPISTAFSSSPPNGSSINHLISYLYSRQVFLVVCQLMGHHHFTLIYSLLSHQILVALCQQIAHRIFVKSSQIPTYSSTSMLTNGSLYLPYLLSRQLYRVRF